MDELGKSRGETLNAFKDRATLYRYFYEEMSEEFGEEAATTLMKNSIYRWGESKGLPHIDLAQNKDFEGTAKEFMEGSPCCGDIFRPSVEEITNSSAKIDMLRCPLVEAWREMGLSPEEVDQICKIANATDYGKYEGMGLKLCIESTIAGGHDRCRLFISR